MPGEGFHPFKGRVSKRFRESVSLHSCALAASGERFNNDAEDIVADVEIGLQLAPDDAYLSCEWPPSSYVWKFNVNS